MFLHEMYLKIESQIFEMQVIVESNSKNLSEQANIYIFLSIHLQES